MTSMITCERSAMWFNILMLTLTCRNEIQAEGLVSSLN